MNQHPYLRPGSLDELWPLLAAHPEARVIAGGTDVMVQLHSRVIRPCPLISLRALPGLDGIEVGEGGTWIGAATPIARLLDHPQLQQRAPVLVQAARVLGSPQIRNVATIGGNLCNASPCADTAPPLLVYEARAAIRGPLGQREIPLQEFFRGPGESALSPGEILEGLRLPPPRPGARGLFLKKRRVRMDLSLASVAVALEFSGGRCTRARIAAGSVAPTPLRLESVERLLEGQPLSDELIGQAAEAAAAAVDPIDDLRASEAYRRVIIAAYLRRALRRLAGAE
jgi:carbon-monoxide dehydrogenase medium subunit